MTSSSWVSTCMWVTTAWSVVLLAGEEMWIASGGLAVLLVAARPRARRGEWRRATVALLLGGLSGFASYPAWIVVLAALGTWLGLPGPVPGAPASAPPLTWISALLLSPVFEELLYRERLLVSLAGPLGAPCAVLFSSALFALSHVAPWPVLATFAVGIALGSVMGLARSVAPCIGMHAGLNLAGLICGAPPVRLAPSALAGAAVAFAAIGAAILSCRHRAAKRRWTGRVAAGMVAMVSLPAAAAELPWEGTAAFEFAAGALPPLILTGAGVATVNASGGGAHLSALHLAGGISASASAPVTDPEITVDGFVAMLARVSVGSGTLAPFAAQPPGLSQGAVPLRGFVGMCLFDPNCLPGGFLALPLSQPGRSAAVGVGGLLTAGGLGAIRISALAAPWTIDTTFLTATTPNGETVAIRASGSRHGPLSFTTSTALPGGVVSLVTPLRVTSEAGAAFTLFGRLRVRLLPEPGLTPLIGCGLAALVVLARWRASRPDRSRSCRG